MMQDMATDPIATTRNLGFSTTDVVDFTPTKPNLGFAPTNYVEFAPTQKRERGTMMIEEVAGTKRKGEELANPRVGTRPSTITISDVAMQVGFRRPIQETNAPIVTEPGEPIDSGRRPAPTANVTNFQFPVRAEIEAPPIRTNTLMLEGPVNQQNRLSIEAPPGRAVGTQSNPTVITNMNLRPRRETSYQETSPTESELERYEAALPPKKPSKKSSTTKRKSTRLSEKAPKNYKEPSSSEEEMPKKGSRKGSKK